MWINPTPIPPLFYPHLQQQRQQRKQYLFSFQKQNNTAEAEKFLAVGKGYLRSGNIKFIIGGKTNVFSDYN